MDALKASTVISIAKVYPAKQMDVHECKINGFRKI
jgi:hypothetical protein